MMEQFMSFLVHSDSISTHIRQVPNSQLDKGSKFTMLIDFNDESAFVEQSEDTVYLGERQVDDGHRRLVLAIKVLLMSIDNTISLFKTRNIATTVVHGMTLPQYTLSSMKEDVRTYCQYLTSIQAAEDSLKQSLTYYNTFSDQIEKIKQELLVAMCFVLGIDYCSSQDLHNYSILHLPVHRQSTYQSCVLSILSGLKQYVTDSRI